MTSPPSYQFKPIHKHFDNGFGATADAFHEAATILEKANEAKKFLHSSLPICYLYRHAVELYLKSIIIVIHRRLKLSEGDSLDITTLKISINDRLFPIHRVHSVFALLGHLSQLMNTHIEQLLSISNTDWTTFPGDLTEWISIIEIQDERSTFFRYPSDSDLSKSDFKERSMGEVFSKLGPEYEPTTSYVELNENNTVKSVFRYEPQGLDSVIDTLRNASNELSVWHFAFRCELAGGE